MPIDDPEVVFQGLGPYHLPAAQRATAHGGDNGVEATLYCLIHGQPRPVRVPMTHGTARELSQALTKAAADAELAQSKS